MGKDKHETGESSPLYPKGTHPDAGIPGRDQSLRVQPEEPPLFAEAIRANSLVYALGRRWWALPPRTQNEWDTTS